MDYYQKKSVRHRKILDLSLAEMYNTQKTETRQLYQLLREQNYNVHGYKKQLELALDYVNRTLAAIEALEKTA